MNQDRPIVQPFTNNHFHFLIKWNRRPPNSCCSRPTKSVMHLHSCAAGRSDNHHGCPFDQLRNLCTISWQASIWWRHHHSPHHQLARKRRSRKHVGSQKPNHTTKFFAGPSFQCSYQCASTYPKNSTRQTYSSAICYMLHLLHGIAPSQNEMLHSHRCYRPGKLTYSASLI
jgi:hypothetical protein